MGVGHSTGSDTSGAEGDDKGQVHTRGLRTQAALRAPLIVLEALEQVGGYTPYSADKWGLKLLYTLLQEWCCQVPKVC